MTNTVLDILPWWQMLLIGVCFVWSGLVRSGLGFGGAALTLPLLLLFVDNPLLFLPAICWHLLFFSALTIATRLENVNWRFLTKLCLLLALPFAAGLAGLLNLPGSVLSLFVYSMTLFYGINYALGRVLSSKSTWLDAVFILFGGYVSGVSLIGAPLIAAVASRQLPRDQVRDTCFVVWIVLVLFKISTFIVADVNLQWRLALLTFPLVLLGHIVGLQVHQRLLNDNVANFHRVIGGGLSAVSVLGLLAMLRKLL